MEGPSMVIRRKRPSMNQRRALIATSVNAVAMARNLRQRFTELLEDDSYLRMIAASSCRKMK